MKYTKKKKKDQEIRTYAAMDISYFIDNNYLIFLWIQSGYS